MVCEVVSADAGSRALWQVVDADNSPFALVFAQMGDAEIIDFMGKAGIGAAIKGALHLGEDDAKMRHGDDAVVGRIQPVDHRASAGGGHVPAFAIGGLNITGFFPKIAAQLWIALCNI